MIHAFFSSARMIILECHESLASWVAVVCVGCSSTRSLAYVDVIIVFGDVWNCSPYDIFSSYQRGGSRTMIKIHGLRVCWFLLGVWLWSVLPGRKWWITSVCFLLVQLRLSSILGLPWRLPILRGQLKQRHFLSVFFVVVEFGAFSCS